jgi:uncharacterized surface anchored protein
MPDPRRHAAALLAVLLLAAPSALAAEPALLAQIDDATPTPTAEGQPPLTEEPEGLDGGEEQEQEQGEEEAEPVPAEEEGEREPLPETGVESALIALLGLGLVATGSGLRLTLGRDAV